ncbi:MFS transporter [Blastococcus xanthinilyticus]|uniref:Putative MFS family arabinose efflux permease n=1 Tax=Blastococcus xanthinilyticus TaxID=1564164 RepID=A0A5S5CRT4_9ACTN|nr:MFS transporter [Blastococcus xanthinilyticus]TYP84909.1 putative MFS family arabinose efflux permease [Blastococcus xanthinilyticus]
MTWSSGRVAVGRTGQVGTPTTGTGRGDTWALRILFAASAVGGLGQSLAGAAGALLAVQVSRSEAVAGLPQAALVAGSAGAALGLSRIAARRGRRASLATGAGVALAGCAAVVVAAAAASLLGLLAGSLLLGAGTTAVMLVRYAAADLAGEGSRARAMASVLVATTVGAVVGPNLLAPAGSLAIWLGVPALSGAYLLSGAAFAVAGLTVMAGLPAPARPAAQPAAALRPPDRLGRDGVVGLVVLGIANLVMVAVMTMAPVQLHHLGHPMTSIGVVVSAHIAAMFAPSPLSGRLTDRLGASRSAGIAGILLVAASLLAVVGAHSLPVLGAAMVLLGSGWNLALISGSVLLTAGARPGDRPRREGWGEAGMGVAAASGSVAAGPLTAGAGYAALAAAGAVVAAFLLPAVLARPRSRAAE